MKATGCGIIALLFCACSAFSAESAREHMRKGSEEFVAGKIQESIRSFESAVKLQPEIKAHLWQLGIAYYYADRFADGRDLFALHQTVNSQDVENAVWHFLCVARLENLEAARKKLIPITRDTRVPMKQVHNLFAGKGSVQDVLDAAKAESDAVERKNAFCYAYLYLALYEEARGDTAKSREYMGKAAGEFQQSHYMGQVAKVHLKLRARQAAPQGPG